MNSVSAGARPRGDAVIFQRWEVKERQIYFPTLTLWRSFLNHWTVAIKVRSESGARKAESPLFLELNSELSDGALTCAASWMDLWRFAETSAHSLLGFYFLTGKIFSLSLDYFNPPIVTEFSSVRNRKFLQDAVGFGSLSFQFEKIWTRSFWIGMSFLQK